jgi:hypothetical protein
LVTSKRPVYLAHLVYLVYSVHLVYLVCLVYLVHLVVWLAGLSLSGWDGLVSVEDEMTEQTRQTE